MSHQPERKEKDCLNCGAIVQGRYCHACGQENVETKESFFSLLKHFVYDIIHFDSKFFDTLKYILFRPGFIAREYVAGKRARFLHPIRMYLFTSALFFLVLSLLNNSKFGAVDVNRLNDTLSKEDRLEAIADLKEIVAQKPGDSAVLKQLARLQDTTLRLTNADVVPSQKDFILKFDKDTIKSLQQYDSVQRVVPASRRDNWFKRQLIRKGFDLNAKYGRDPNEGLQHFFELFQHRLPYLLFVSLPFFALLLKLLYVRRKDFFYSDHAIFTLYHYIFSFILLLVVFLFSQLADWTHLKLLKTLIPFLLLLWPVYLLVALKKFYGQGWGKTFSKFLLLNLLGIIVLLLLFLVFLFFTLFQL